MVRHSSTLFFKKVSMNAMLILVACLEPVFILLKILPKVINMFMALAADQAVLYIKTNRVTYVKGNCCYAALPWESLFISSQQSRWHILLPAIIPSLDVPALKDSHLLNMLCTEESRRTQSTLLHIRLSNHVTLKDRPEL